MFLESFNFVYEVWVNFVFYVKDEVVVIKRNFELWIRLEKVWLERLERLVLFMKYFNWDDEVCVLLSCGKEYGCRYDESYKRVWLNFEVVWFVDGYVIEL